MSLDDDMQTLQTAPDPDSLQAAALRLARGGSGAAGHAALAARITSEPFLQRLDTPQEYEQDNLRLRLAGLLDALAQHPAPSASAVLNAAAASRCFLDAWRRAHALVWAARHVRPPTPELLAFWERHATPRNGATNLTVQALFENRSEPALALLERLLRDSGFLIEQRLDWLRYNLLPQRTDAGLLAWAERLWRSSLPTALREGIIDVLFDDRPLEWFGYHAPLHPPPREQLTPAGRATLLRIGVAALGQDRQASARRTRIEEMVEWLRGMEAAQ